MNNQQPTDELLAAALDGLAVLNMLAQRHANEPAGREYQEIIPARRALCLAVSKAEGRVIGGSLSDMKEAAEMLKEATK